MAKITETDTLESAILKMAAGVAAAMEVLKHIVEQGPIIDPEPRHSGFSHLFLLDEWEIYGTEIYILYKDKCGSDIRKLLLLLRAVQLDKYSKSKLKELAGDQFNRVSISDGVWRELDYIVCGEVSGFKPN